MTIEAKTVASFAESVQHEVKSLLFQEEKRAGKFILDSSENMTKTFPIKHIFQPFSILLLTSA